MVKSLEGYGVSFQRHLIQSLRTEKSFLKSVYDVLSSEYFSHNAHKWLIDRILEHYNKYDTCIPVQAIIVALKDNNLDEEADFASEVKQICQIKEPDVQYYRDVLVNFLKVKKGKQTIMEHANKLQAGEDVEALIEDLELVKKIGGDRDVGHEYDKDIEDRFIEDVRHEIPTPWDKINQHIQGGLGRGDFGLIFGNPGGGKSWSLVALGGHAVEMGYNVVHYTLELDEHYVGRRYDAYYTNISVQDVIKHKDEVIEKVSNLKGKLIIKDFAMGKASLNTIKAHLQKVEDNEFKPDLVIIDYVDLLKSGRSSSERKQEIDDIYTSTKGLARELKIPIWSVSQVNRSGAQEKIIEGDKAAGSYDKIMITDICLSLSRRKEDKVNGTGRFHFMKNRYGMDGMTFSVEADTSTGHFVVSDYTDLDDEDRISPEASTNILQKIKSLQPKDLPF
jgi:replicative DNA helicase